MSLPVRRMFHLAILQYLSLSFCWVPHLYYWLDIGTMTKFQNLSCRRGSRTNNILDVDLQSDALTTKALQKNTFFEKLCSPGFFWWGFLFWSLCDFWGFLKWVLDPSQRGQRLSFEHARAKKLTFLFEEIDGSNWYSF